MRKIDLILLFAIIIISIFGLVMIYSSSYVWAEYKFNNPYKFVITQGIFLVVGYILLFFLLKIPYYKYFEYSNIIFFVCLLLLVLVLIPGIGSVRNGSRSWFGIGGLGIQPSEFTKLGLIIFTAKYLTTNEINLKQIKNYVIPILMLVFFIFGLIMLQPDFGTGIIIVITILCMLFISGVKLSFFIILGLIGLLGITILILIAPYRLLRIASFIDPWKDPLGSGFQMIQSLYHHFSHLFLLLFLNILLHLLYLSYLFEMDNILNLLINH